MEITLIRIRKVSGSDLGQHQLGPANFLYFNRFCLGHFWVSSLKYVAITL